MPNMALGVGLLASALQSLTTWSLASSHLAVDETSARAAAEGDVSIGLTTSAATWQLDLLADYPDGAASRRLLLLH